MLGRARRAILATIAVAVLGLLAGSRVSAGPTSRVSQATTGTQTDGQSYTPSVSATGRFVAFASDATNLVLPTTTNDVTQVYIRDRDADADSPYDFDDASASDPDNDPANVTTTLASVDGGGNAGTLPSTSPAISADGRFVAFVSAANLVPGVSTNGVAQIYVRDRQPPGGTTLGSLDAAGNPGNADSFAPTISSDGRFVAFASYATTLTQTNTSGVAQIYVRDRDVNGGTTFDAAGNVATILVSVNGSAAGNADSVSPSISWDGRNIAFSSAADNLVSGDTNGASDVFLRSRDADNDSDYDDLAAADPSSPSDANAVSAVTTTRVSVVTGTGGEANAGSFAPAISANGKTVAFSSTATNLESAVALNGFSQIFVHTGATTSVVSVDTYSDPPGSADLGNGDSAAPALSYDGRYVTFQSRATNLVAGDTNGAWDIFVHDQTSVPGSNPAQYLTYRSSADSSGSQANADSLAPAINAEGRFVAIVSSATNLMTGDTNGADDIFTEETNTPGGDNRWVDGYSDALKQALSPPKPVGNYCAIMRADLNGDGASNGLDLNLLSKQFLKNTPPANPRIDQNFDSVINALDLNILARYFLQFVSACP